MDPSHMKDIPRFLNKLLGLQLDDQAQLFEYFSGVMDVEIKAAKSAGTFETGIKVRTVEGFEGRWEGVADIRVGG